MVHVHRWRLRARSADPPSEAARLERAVQAAFDTLAAELGPAVAVFERLELHARDVRGARFEPSVLTRELLQILRRKLRTPTATGVRVFESESEARLRLLEAIVAKRQAVFPWRALRHWGESLGDVDQWPRPVLGDVLASLTAEDRTWLTPEVAARWLKRWSSGIGPRLVVETLPPDLVERHRGGVTAVSDPVERLVAVARLFRDWPPARDLDLPATNTQETPQAMPSQAGHLVLWGALLDQTERDPIRRYERSADRTLVRWGIGRALSSVDVVDHDPGLLRFAGEAPAGRGPTLTRFGECSPGPLAGWAVGALEAEPPLVLGRLFDGTPVLFDSSRPLGVWFGAEDPLARSVAALRGVLGNANLTIEEVSSVPDRIRDCLQRNDVPRLPGAWRSALIATGGVLERLAHEHWGAVPPRSLPALVTAEGAFQVTADSVWGDRARALGRTF